MQRGPPAFRETQPHKHGGSLSAALAPCPPEGHLLGPRCSEASPHTAYGDCPPQEGQRPLGGSLSSATSSPFTPR